MAHYATRLEEVLDDETGYSIAMKILAEAATQGVFTANVSHRLERLYSTVIENPSRRITETLDVLVHDGYLEAKNDGYRFLSRLLKDWWSARFRDHHTPLDGHLPDDDRGSLR